MRSLRSFAPVAVLLLAPALAACGGDDGGDDTDANEGAPASSSSPDAPESDAGTDTGSDDATDSSSAPAAELPSACDVVSREEVALSFGVDFGPAEPGGGGNDENGTAWQSDNCSWESEGLVEVQLAISAPQDYDPKFICPEPEAGDSTTVEQTLGLGDSAWWVVDRSEALETTLRVCTSDYNFDIDLDFEDGTDFDGDPKSQSSALALIVQQVLG